MHQIDGFDMTVEEGHATQQLADRAHDIGDIEVARRHFVQHRGKEEKVVAVDKGDIQVSALCKRLLEFQGGIHATEPTAQNQNSWLPVRHKLL